MINIELDAHDLYTIKSKLGELSNRSHVVLARAVKRTVTHTKVNIAKEANLQYLINQKTVKQTLKSSKATSKNPVAIISSKGSPIPLYNFDINPRRRVKRLKRKSKSRNLYSPNIYSARTVRKSERVGVKRMFVAKNQALTRPENATSEENRNVKNWIRFGPSVPQMIGNRAYDEIQRKAINKLRERVNHEIEYELGRIKI